MGEAERTVSTSTLDSSILPLLPGPIALAATELREATGERAGALVRLVDALLGHLARLWVAELLHAGVPDPGLHRALLGLPERRLMLGGWLGLAADARRALERAGVPTVLEGLGDVELPSVVGRDVPVARLAGYRRLVAHAGLRARTEVVAAHERLAWDTIAALPTLWREPVCFWDGRGRACLSARLSVGRAPVETTGPPLEPFVAARRGTLPLYPLMHVVERPDGWQLTRGPALGLQPLEALLRREPLRLLHARHTAEREGRVDLGAPLRELRGPVPDAVAAAVRGALVSAARPRPVVVEAHPGAGAEGLAGALARAEPTLVPVGVFAEVVAWRVEPDGTGRSAQALAARLAERVHAVSGAPPGGASDPLAALERAAGCTLPAPLLVVVDGLHHGLSPAAGEAMPVAELLDWLADRPDPPVRIVALGWPLGALAPLPAAVRVRWPAPPPSGFDDQGLAAAVATLTDGAPLRRRVLAALVEAPLALHPLCDALEDAGPAPVVEPAVRLALEELSPVLERCEDGAGVPTWGLVSPGIVAALEGGEP